MESIGKILEISELNVKILLYDNKIKIKDVVTCKMEEKEYEFEVVEIEENIAYAIPFERVIGLKKGIEVAKKKDGLTMEYSDNILGRVFSPYGKTIDNEKKIKSIQTKNVYERRVGIEEISINNEPLWTGIKALDFFAPLQKDIKWDY